VVRAKYSLLRIGGSPNLEREEESVLELVDQEKIREWGVSVEEVAPVVVPWEVGQVILKGSVIVVIVDFLSSSKTAIVVVVRQRGI